MNYQVRRLCHLSDDEMLRKLHRASKDYEKIVDTILLFIYMSGQSDTDMKYVEIYYGKRNFMHLAGVKSKTKSAEDFFEACLAGTVRKEDCSPRHSLTNMYEKISVIDQLFDFKSAKIYRIGEKDLITRDNDFMIATGNASGIIGYDKRNLEFDYPMPTTLLTNPITNYCTNPEKIKYIFQKNNPEGKYDVLFYEIKKDLFASEREKMLQDYEGLIG